MNDQALRLGVIDERRWHETLPTVNVPLLRKGVEWVLAESRKPLVERQWEQRWWRTLRTGTDSCGTAFCLAGFVCELDPHWEWESAGIEYGYLDDGAGIRLPGTSTSGNSASTWARTALGLLRSEAEWLFHEGNTAEDVLEIAQDVCRSRGEELGVEF